MMLDTEAFLLRTRGLVSALALLQLAQPGSHGYAEFRAKVRKGVGFVLTSVRQLLGDVLKAEGENAQAVDALADADLLRLAGQHGVLSTEETQRWLEYFERRNIVAGKAADALPEDALALLRALAVDARSLEIGLRNLEVGLPGR